MGMRNLGIKYFTIQELVPLEIFNRFGSKSIMFIDLDIVRCADLFRELVGSPVNVNDWWNNGLYSESGFRMPDTTTGGKLSQHKFGRALDLKVKGMTSKQMAEVIFSAEKDFMSLGLTTIEDPIFTTGIHQDWLHIDSRNTGRDKVQIVTPWTR